jgi:hypothetical protein
MGFTFLYAYDDLPHRKHAYGPARSVTENLTADIGVVLPPHTEHYSC